MVNENTFKSFIGEITNGYSRDIPYHNDLHATDVLQTLYVFLERGNIYYKCGLTEIDIFALLLSAICHDFKHPGRGNSYLVNSKNEIAMNFNGK